MAVVSRTDLKWWLAKEPELDWRFATTYAETAPHEYVVAGVTSGFDPQDAARAAHVIRTFGEPMKFYRSTRIYLTTPLGWKHWDMQGAVLDDGDVQLINRGRVEHVYGVQNGPRTASGVDSEYDGIATTWDRGFGMTAEEQAATMDLVSAIFGSRLGRTLDVGCGTGWPLDAGLVDAVRYIGVDPSTAMLNALVLKHPTVAAVHPKTLESAIVERVLGGTRFDSVVALGGSASYLWPADLAVLLSDHASRGALLMHYAPEERPIELDRARADAVLAASSERADSMARIGRFLAVVMR